MNNKFIYIPIILLVLGSVIVLTMEIEHFNSMLGFGKLLVLTVAGVAILVSLSYKGWLSRQSGEDKYVATGSTILFGFVVILALISWGNRQYAMTNCKEDTFTVTNYEPRFASGYGNIENGKPAPNQWILSIKDMGIDRTFTLSQDIMTSGVTNTVNLVFCYGVWKTKYLSLK